MSGVMSCHVMLVAVKDGWKAGRKKARKGGLEGLVRMASSMFACKCSTD
jgi:hypothetical protein